MSQLGANAALNLIRDLPDVISSNFRFEGNRKDILFKVVAERMERTMQGIFVFVSSKEI